MSPSAIAIFAAVIVIGITVFARSELFRPKVKSAYSTNPFVRILMDVSAFLCAWVAFELWGYQGVIPEGLVWLMGAFAITSTAMFVSMMVHDGRLIVAQVRAEDVGIVEKAVHEAMAPAMDAANARLLDRMAPTDGAAPYTYPPEPSA